MKSKFKMGDKVIYAIPYHLKMFVGTVEKVLLNSLYRIRCGFKGLSAPPDICVFSGKYDIDKQLYPIMMNVEEFEKMIYYNDFQDKIKDKMF